MKLHLSLLSALLLTLPAAPVFSQDAERTPAPDVAPVKLIPVFRPGKNYQFSSSTAIRMKLKDRPDMESIIMLQQEVELKATPRALGKPGVVLTGSTKSVKFRMEAGKRVIAYDSTAEDSANTDIGKHFQNSLERWTIIELSPDQKIVSRNDAGGGGSATPLPQLPEIGPDQIQQMIAALITNFPPDPVAPGQEWIQRGETNLGQFGKMNFEITNQYVGDKLVENAVCAAIQFRGSLKGGVKLEPQKNRNLDFEGNEMSGRVLFDKNLGMSRINEQIVVLRIKNPELPETTIEQQIQIMLTSVEDNS